MSTNKHLHDVARRTTAVDILLGNSKAADVVLTGGTVINVITKETYPADIAISGDIIVLVGDCERVIGERTKIIDCSGKYLSPGFIDAHMHFESAMLTATEFTRLSLPTGTTCLINDPHEIGNVLGPDGIRAMCEECAQLPQHVFSRVPALTPDSPGLETAGYNITSEDIPEMLEYPTVTGIGEIQGISAIGFVHDHNYDVVLDTIVSTTYARSNGYGVDGNAPELFGAELAAHIICGGTDISCHETTTKEECIEKLRNGVYVLMREGSTQRNMPECIRAYTEDNVDSRRLLLATDDMLAEDIATTGHMNDIIRRTIGEGVDPVTAIQMATINPATWLGLSEIGALLPGKQADIAVIDSPLEQMNVSSVLLAGKLVAEDRKLLINLPEHKYPQSVKNSVNRSKITEADLQVKSDADGVKARCIGLIVDQNLTDAFEVDLKVTDGVVQPDFDNDILPISVVGRHGQKDIGNAFIKGFKLESGAMAETVSHDTHNIIVVGTSYEDMVVAVNRLIDIQGGLVLAKNQSIIGELRLPVAGLITDEMSASELTTTMSSLTTMAREKLGCTVPAPFMHLAFVSLTTSPKWKITDKGIVDANNYCVLPTLIEQ